MASRLADQRGMLGTVSVVTALYCVGLEIVVSTCEGLRQRRRKPLGDVGDGGSVDSRWYITLEAELPCHALSALISDFLHA